MAKIDKKIQGAENLKWGHEAEQIAANYFLMNGYAIRERNWRQNHAEIDIILERDRTIIFVEVKARLRGDEEYDEALMAVDVKKRRRLVRAADAYMRMLPVLYEYRFDIFTVTGTPEDHTCRHYADAFMPEINNGYRH